MRGIIIEIPNLDYYIVGRLLRGITRICKEYNWLITYPECYPRNPKYSEIFKKKRFGLMEIL